MFKMSKIKRYFITGLIAVIPIASTIAILALSLKIVNSLLSMPISRVFGIKYRFLSGPLDFFSGVFITIFVILITGYITTKIGKRGIFGWIKNLVGRVPVISNIYASVKQLVEIFILNKAIEGFTRVVLVEYPREGTYAIGFVTAKSSKDLDKETGKRLINVYFPNSFDLASGFFVLVCEDEVIQLDIPVDEGFKMVVSGGLIIPEKWQE
ncbi:MAG: DUF502 domain-containing protein [bacterium]